MAPQDSTRPRRPLEFGSTQPRIPLGAQDYAKSAYQEAKNPAADSSPFEAERRLESQFGELDPKNQQALQGIREMLDSRLGQRQKERFYKVPEGIEASLARAREKLPQAYGLRGSFADVMGSNLTTGLGSALDTVADLARGAVTGQYDSGVMEGLFAGAKTPEEAKQKIRNTFTGLDGGDIQILQWAAQQDAERKQVGLPGLLTDEELERIQNLGVPGIAGGIADLAGKGAMAATVDRFLPGGGGKLGGLARGMASWGIAGGLASQDPKEAAIDAAFGGGAELAGQGMNMLANNLFLKWSAANRANLARVARGASNLPQRRGGLEFGGAALRSIAEMQGGRLAASAVPGGDVAPFDPVTDIVGGVALGGLKNVTGGPRPKSVKGEVEVPSRAQISGRGKREVKADARDVTPKPPTPELAAEAGGPILQREAWSGSRNPRYDPKRPYYDDATRGKRPGTTRPESKPAPLEVVDAPASLKMEGEAQPSRPAPLEVIDAADEISLGPLSRRDPRSLTVTDRGGRQIQRPETELPGLEVADALPSIEVKDARSPRSLKRSGRGPLTNPLDQGSVRAYEYVRDNLQENPISQTTPKAIKKKLARAIRERRWEDAASALHGTYTLFGTRKNPEGFRITTNAEKSFVRRYFAADYHQRKQLYVKLQAGRPIGRPKSTGRDVAKKPAIERAGAFSPEEFARVLNESFRILTSKDTRGIESRRALVKRYNISIKKQSKNKPVPRNEWRKLVYAYNAAQREIAEKRIGSSAPAQANAAAAFQKSLKDHGVSVLTNAGVRERAIKESGIPREEWVQHYNAAVSKAAELREQVRPVVERVTEDLALTPKGREVVAEYMATREAMGEHFDIQDVRDKFGNKLKGTGKWEGSVKQLSPEERLDEANRALDRVDQEISSQARQQELAFYEKNQQASEIVARLARPDRAKGATPKADKPVEQATEAAGRMETTRDPNAKTPYEELLEKEEGARRKAVVDEIEAVFQEHGKKAFDGLKIEDIEQAMHTGDLAAIRRKLAEAVGRLAGKLRGRKTRKGGFQVEMFRGKGGNIGGTYDLGAVLSAVMSAPGKIVAAGARALTKYLQRKFPRLSAHVARLMVALRHPFRQRGTLSLWANKMVNSENTGYLVRTTPPGPAKKIAERLHESAYWTEAKSAEIRDGLVPYIDDMQKAGQLKWSKENFPKSSSGESLNGWQEQVLNKAARTPTVNALEKAKTDVYETGRASGMTRTNSDGSVTPLPPPGKEPMLLHILSDDYVHELVTNPKGPVVARSRELAKVKPENIRRHNEMLMDLAATPGHWAYGKPLHQIEDKIGSLDDRVDKYIDKLIEAHSPDPAIQLRNATEKMAAFEFTRELELPAFGDGFAYIEPSYYRYNNKYFQSAPQRIAFENTMRGVDLVKYQKTFEAGGGNTRDMAIMLNGMQGRRTPTGAVHDYRMTRGLRTPGRWLEGVFIAPQRTMMLTGSAVPNINDAFFGSIAQSVGFKRAVLSGGREIGAAAVRGLKVLRGNPELASSVAKTWDEAMSLVPDRSIAQKTPTDIMEGVSKNVQLVVSRLTYDWANRINERSGPRAAADWTMQMVKDWPGLSAAKKAELLGTFEQHGAPPMTARWILEGRAPEFIKRRWYKLFAESVMAARGGELSKTAFQRNPVMAFSFWFTNYALKTAGQLKRIVSAMRDGKPGSTKRLFKFLGWQYTKGMTGMLAAAALRGDNINPFDDDSVFWSKWKSNLSGDQGGWGVLSVLFEPLAYGAVFGPFSAPFLYAKDDGSKWDMAASLTGPGALLNMYDSYWSGTGRYKDKDALEKAVTYFTQGNSGARILSSIAPIIPFAGIKENNDLNLGRYALYDWMDSHIEGGSFDAKGGYDEMRANIRRGMEKMDEWKDPSADFRAAIGANSGDAGEVSAGLRSRKMLDGKIKAEHYPELQKYMGKAAFEALQMHDQVLEGWARVVTEMKGGKAHNAEDVAKQKEQLSEVTEIEGLDKMIREGATERTDNIGRMIREIERGKRGEAPRDKRLEKILGSASNKTELKARLGERGYELFEIMASGAQSPQE